MERACEAYWRGLNEQEDGGGYSWPHCSDGSAERARIRADLMRKWMRAALSAATIGTGGQWTRDLPTKQMTYWHWDGDEDSAPLPCHVLTSATDDRRFVSANQYGVPHAVDCADMGGWWLPCPTPKTPEIDK